MARRRKERRKPHFTHDARSASGWGGREIPPFTRSERFRLGRQGDPTLHEVGAVPAGVAGRSRGGLQPLSPSFDWFRIRSHWGF